MVKKWSQDALNRKYCRKCKKLQKNIRRESFWKGKTFVQSPIFVEENFTSNVTRKFSTYSTIIMRVCEWLLKIYSFQWYKNYDLTTPQTEKIAGNVKSSDNTFGGNPSVKSKWLKWHEMKKHFFFKKQNRQKLFKVDERTCVTMPRRCIFQNQSNYHHTTNIFWKNWKNVN